MNLHKGLTMRRGLVTALLVAAAWLSIDASADAQPPLSTVTRKVGQPYTFRVNDATPATTWTDWSVVGSGDVTQQQLGPRLLSVMGTEPSDVWVTVYARCIVRPYSQAAPGRVKVNEFRFRVVP